MPIHPLDGAEAELPSSVECWIAPTAVLIGNVRLTPHASIWFGSVLRADDDPIEIGKRSNVQDSCVLHVEPSDPLSIGEGCAIDHKAMLHGCTIGSNLLIGTDSSVLNGARIERNCLIGANTLITEGKVILDNSLVMGASGKVVREIDQAGIANLSRGAALHGERWRHYMRGLGPQASV